MKVKAKMPFYDANGLHLKGEIIDVKKFDANHMDLIEEKAEKVEEPAKEEAPVKKPRARRTKK